MPLPGTEVQEKGNAANVGHGTTLGKLARKERNPPKLILWEATTTPKESCSPWNPWLLLGIVIAEPQWGFSRVWYGVELTLQQCLPSRHPKAPRDFRVLLGDLGFLVSIVSRGNRAEAPRPSGEACGHGQRC